MINKKSAFSSAFSQQHNSNLTKVQSEVLYLLTKEFLTPKQIAIRRGTKIRTIQATIKKLKDLGIINNAFKEVRFNAPTNAFSFGNANMVRLHGEEWNIKILYKDNNYKETIKKTNFVDYDGNTIRLSRDSIEIYSGKSFYGDDPDKATVRSFEYWNRFFVKLENHLKIVLKKSRVQNIRRVNAHYSEVNNEFSKQCDERGERIRVYTRDDGKLWFTIDNSFNLHEAECQHPITSKDDIDVVKDFFNGVRGGKWHEIVSKVEVMFKFQDRYAENIKSHLEAINYIKFSMIEMSKTMKDIRKYLKK